MLSELEKNGYLTTIPSPKHGRKRLVTITRLGSELVSKGKRLLESQFADIMLTAGVDAKHYQEVTEQLHRALAARMNEPKS
jgi:DNA-binding MarR family transcriptional regulator